jgi:hypothetical protein
LEDFFIMTRSQEQTYTILSTTKSGWYAGVEYDDLILSIDFSPDGSGEMVYGEAPAIRMETTFFWRLLDEQHLQIRFSREGEPEEIKIVQFALDEGPFTSAGYYEEQTYPYRLRFASEPLPEGEGPQEELLDYYSR